MGGCTLADEPKLTDEEHKARAMLMGMIYHHGNGSPFYYKGYENGVPIIASIIDADTLEPILGWLATGRKNLITQAVVERYEEVRYRKGWKK